MASEEVRARARLRDPVRDRRAATTAVDEALQRLYEVIREVAPYVPRQTEIIQETVPLKQPSGWSREHIRRITRGETSWAKSEHAEK